uniref:Ground-like domain-containing protein n=1 Tax=Panagrolaimus davidi TaxID=227884 RepID=A0A914P3R8_9BILA
MKVVFPALFLIFIIVQKTNSRRCSRADDGNGGGDGGGGGPPKYPLPECKTNGSGFMCCNDGVEDVVKDAIDDLKKQKAKQGEKFSNCNLQMMANKIQEMAEKKFNTTFETMVGISNFASKTRFFGNMVCKVKRGNRYVLAFATPKNTDATGDDEDDDDEPRPANFKRLHHTFTWRV